ncbi:hypothetical protein YC2023_039013 [Brassica napus]
MEKEVAMEENASSWIQSEISLRGEQRVRHRGVVHEEGSCSYDVLVLRGKSDIRFFNYKSSLSPRKLTRLLRRFLLP